MIYFYGKLRKLFGDSIDCKVNSVQELMKAAEANIPGFKGHIDKDRKYIIRRGKDFRTAKEVDAVEVEMKFTEEDWHILPMPIGCGKALNIIIGVVLIAASWYVGGAAGWGYLGAQGYAGATMAFGTGLGMIAGGIAQLLTPTPTGMSQESGDNKPSYLFDGPTNRSNPGSTVPLVYGFDVFVGSIFTSGGLDIGDLV